MPSKGPAQQTKVWDAVLSPEESSEVSWGRSQGAYMGALSGNREMLGDCKSISMEHPWATDLILIPFQMIEVKLPKAFLSLWDAVQELGWTGPAWEEWSTGEQSQMWFPGQRDESLLTLYLPHPAKCLIHTKKTREIFGERFRSERGFQIPFHHFGRYLPAFLARPCLLEPFIQCHRENAIPPLHYCSLPRKMMTW